MVYRLSPLDDVFSVGAALLYGLLALLDVGLFIFSFYRDRSSARHRVLAGWRMRLVFALLVALGVARFVGFLTAPILSHFVDDPDYWLYVMYNTLIISPWLLFGLVVFLFTVWVRHYFFIHSPLM